MNPFLKKTLFPALVTGLITLAGGYLLGGWEHQLSSGWEKKKIVHEQQIKVWQSMATNFPKYLVARMRMMKMSEGLQKNYAEMSKLTKAERDAIPHRMERYLEERDSSRLGLMADLEQAKYLFPESKPFIDSFEEFESNSGKLDSSRSSPEDALRTHMNAILEKTFAEIKPL